MERDVTLLTRFMGRVLVGAVLLLGSSRLPAQIQDSASQPPPPHPPADSQEPGPDESLQTFKAQVNVVNLFFNVKDKHGMLIPNLTKNDFEVLEDGKP